MNMTSEMPQDSVLRRHWQAARSIESGTGNQSSTYNSSSTQQTGFFAWLKSLFS